MIGRETSVTRLGLGSRPTRTSRTLSAVALAGALALAAAGCSEDKAEAPSGEQPPAAAAPGTTTGVVSPKLKAIPDLKGSAGVVKDATMKACSTEPGKVQAEGAVTNSAAKTKDIVVVISWVTPTSDVVARAVTAIKDLKPGQSSDWTASSSLDFDGSAQCVMTVTAGTLKA